jgi:hypothetical protein
MRRQEIDRLYDRARNSAMAVCTIWPIAIVVVTPWLLENIWLGMMILVASIAQFFWAPHAFASWMTRDLHEAAKGQDEEAGPTASFRPENYRKPPDM